MDPYLAAVVHDDHRRTQQQEQHPRIVSQNAATQIAGSQHSVRVHPTQNSAVTATAVPRTPPSARRLSMYASSAPQNQWAHACDNVIATRFPEHSPEHVTTTQEISERRKFHASARLIRELNTADICNVLGTTTTDLMRHDPSRVAASLLRALSVRNADSINEAARTLYYLRSRARSDLMVELAYTDTVTINEIITENGAPAYLRQGIIWLANNANLPFPINTPIFAAPKTSSSSTKPATCFSLRILASLEGLAMDGDGTVASSSLRVCDSFAGVQRMPVYPVHVLNATHGGLLGDKDMGKILFPLVFQQQDVNVGQW